MTTISMVTMFIGLILIAIDGFIEAVPSRMSILGLALMIIGGAT